MSVLTKKEIQKLIKKKKVVIEPFDEKNIGPASIDLILDNKFRILTKGKQIDIKNDTDYTKSTKLIIGKSIVMKPGDVVLGITKEKITLPSNVCGWLQGRSRFARLGLMIHISSAFVQPGVSNKQVLEIVNLSKRTIKLNAGIRFCQIVLQQTKGNAEYKGSWQGQETP